MLFHIFIIIVIGITMVGIFCTFFFGFSMYDTSIRSKMDHIREDDTIAESYYDRFGYETLLTVNNR
jgi:hypothetical protein